MRKKDSSCMSGTSKGRNRRKNEVLLMTEKIPANCPIDDLTNRLKDILREINRTLPGEFYLVYEALHKLVEQPHIVEALIALYTSTPKTAFQMRMLILSTIGELKRQDSFEFLKAESWKQLPEIEERSGCSVISERDYEAMTSAKAVHGIGFLRTEEAYEELIKVMLDHESKHVVISAINSYMWNKGDTKEAANILYDTLPEEWHPYVERPRFHRNVDRDEFDRRRIEWRKKWVDGRETEEAPEKEVR
jgi:hypothetical protein